MNNDVTTIRTGAGELQIWEARPGKFSFSTPNGSDGVNEESFNEAVKSAFFCEGLKASDYGY